MKKKFFIFGALVLILLVFMSFVLPKQPKPLPYPNLTTPTPLVISPNPTSVANQEMKVQEKLDQQTGKDIQDVNTNYPWYKNLPLQTASYYVDFDTLKKVFLVDIYPSQASSLSVNDQINNLKTAVLNQMQGLGIDTSSYQIVWSITPEP